MSSTPTSIRHAADIRQLLVTHDPSDDRLRESIADILQFVKRDTRASAKQQQEIATAAIILLSPTGMFTPKAVECLLAYTSKHFSPPPSP